MHQEIPDLTIRKFWFEYYPATPGGSVSLMHKNGKLIYRNTTEFGGIDVDNNQVLILGREDECMPVTGTMPKVQEVSPERLLKFYRYISRYCRNWKKKYGSPVCDGSMWSCDFHIGDFKLKSEGRLEFPGNFKTFLFKLKVLTNGREFEF